MATDSRTRQAESTATIYDIAKITGCSPATVSRAINHPEQVRPGTLSAIRDAMQAEGFARRGYRARQQSSRKDARTGRYLLMIPGAGNPFYGQIIEGALNAASAHGCRLLVSYADSSDVIIPGQNDAVESDHYDGIILMTGLPDDREGGRSYSTPVIQCSEYNETLSGVSLVSINDEAGMRKMTEHVIASGRRRLAYISCPAGMRYAVRRMNGFRLACASHGITVPDSRVITLPQTGFEIAHSAALRLLAAPEKPDAVICSSDVYAIACLKAAHTLGIRVPEDLAITGFDDIPLASMVDPAITTIRQPRYQLGFTAFETLFHESQNPETEKQQIFLPTDLVIRETTAVRRSL